MRSCFANLNFMNVYISSIQIVILLNVTVKLFLKSFECFENIHICLYPEIKNQNVDLFPNLLKSAS